jgi:putative ABC transport system ATP-binding protein
MADPIIRIEGLEQRYGAAVVLTMPTWHLHAGEQRALAGVSGSGKSTLLHLLGGLLRPTSGSVKVLDVAMESASEHRRDHLRATSISYIFQTLNLLPSCTVLQNVLLGAPGDRRAIGLRHADAMQWLTRMGVAGLAGRLPQACSQGQQQRIAVARACMKSPQLLLADEPTAHLDPDNAGQVITLLQEIARETGAALVLASHDPAVLGEFPIVTRLLHGALMEVSTPC